MDLIQDQGRGWNIFKGCGSITQPYWGESGVDDRLPGVRVSPGASGDVCKVNLEESRAETLQWPILSVLLAELRRAPKVYVSQHALCFQPQKLNKRNNHRRICQFGINLGRKSCCCSQGQLICCGANQSQEMCLFYACVTNEPVK